MEGSDRLRRLWMEESFLWLFGHRFSIFFLEHAVSVMSGEDFVDRNLFQSHAVQVTKPLFPLLLIPSLFRRSHVVESLQSFLLERTRRVHCSGGGRPEMRWGCNYSDAGSSRNRNQFPFSQPSFKIV